MQSELELKQNLASKEVRIFSFLTFVYGAAKELWALRAVANLSNLHRLRTLPVVQSAVANNFKQYKLAELKAHLNQIGESLNTELQAQGWEAYFHSDLVPYIKKNILNARNFNADDLGSKMIKNQTLSQLVTGAACHVGRIARQLAQAHGYEQRIPDGVWQKKLKDIRTAVGNSVDFIVSSQKADVLKPFLRPTPKKKESGKKKEDAGDATGRSQQYAWTGDSLSEDTWKKVGTIQASRNHGEKDLVIVTSPPWGVLNLLHDNASIPITYLHTRSPERRGDRR